MSRHISRKERWNSFGPDEYRSVEGLVVRRFKGQWWAEVSYRVRQPGAPEDAVTWESHSDRLGPFRRPRNAMVEAERHASSLRNHHGGHVRLPGDPEA